MIDTAVLASAARSHRGAGSAVLELIARRQVVPLVTPALLLEYEAGLKRDEQRRVSGLSLDQVDRMLSALASAMEPVEVHISWRPQLADADDERVLAAAICSRAEALVTYNVRDFAPAARFGIPVLRPGEFLTRIRS